MKSDHCSTSEVRKRVFWNAQQRTAIPLSMRRKRQMLANFDRELRSSRRAGRPFELGPRGDEACVVCACKGWSETRFLVNLWEPYNTLAEPSSHGTVGDIQVDAPGPESAWLLKDKQGIF